MRNFLHYVFAGGSFTLYTAALGNTGSFSAGAIDWYIYLIMMVVCVAGGTLCAKLSIKFDGDKKGTNQQEENIELQRADREIFKLSAGSKTGV